jgi:hypothetical protein
MVTYNASDKDELHSILANQRRVLEDIESRLRNLDAENDDRIETIIDTRMQRNAIVDHHQLQLLPSTHQSALQQTVTDSLMRPFRRKRLMLSQHLQLSARNWIPINNPYSMKSKHNNRLLPILLRPIRKKKWMLLQLLPRSVNNYLVSHQQSFITQA